MLQKYSAILISCFTGVGGVFTYKYMMFNNHSPVSFDEPIQINESTNINKKSDSTKLDFFIKLLKDEKHKKQLKTYTDVLFDLRTSYKKQVTDILKYIKSLGDRAYLDINHNENIMLSIVGNKMDFELFDNDQHYIAAKTKNSYVVIASYFPGVLFEDINKTTEKYYFYVPFEYDFDVSASGHKGISMLWKQDNEAHMHDVKWSFMVKDDSTKIKDMGIKLKEITDELIKKLKVCNSEFGPLCGANFVFSNDKVTEYNQNSIQHYQDVAVIQIK